MAVASQPQRTGWVGWIIFAGVMMLILATFHVIDGLTALFNDEYFIVGKDGLVVKLDYTAWGVAHVALGALMAFAAFSLFAGRMFGRILGVVVAAVSAIVNVAFLASYPVWSVVMIALDIIVLYAILVHGRELEEE